MPLTWYNQEMNYTQKLKDKQYNLQQTHTCLVTSLLLVIKLLIIPMSLT